MHALTSAGRAISGRYRLDGPLGRGAMGIVWRGRDQLLDREVAIKEIQITSLAAPAEAERMYQRTLREARTAARLSHPSVITVYDVVEENGCPWIVMELVHGRSLDQVIAEDGPLPPAQAAGLGRSLLSALATAHAAGVLHRDVKPSNVLLQADGRTVLTDFGIATFEGDPGLTQAGMVVGTPGFTAPERVRGQAATPASDLWSLGATLYAAVEGRGPFDRPGGSAAITAGVITDEAPPAPSAGPLGPVIGALLRRDPAARPGSAAAARLLAEASERPASGPRPLSGPGQGSWGRPGAEAGAAAAADGTTASLAAGSGLVAPPVFAELVMPGTVLSESAGPDSAGGLPGTAQLPAFLDSPMPASSAAPPDLGAPWGPAAAPVSWESVVPPGHPGPAEHPGHSGPSGSCAGCQPPGQDGPGLAPSARAAQRSRSSGNSSSGQRSSGQRSSRHWRTAAAALGAAAVVVAAIAGWEIYSRSPVPASAAGRAPAGSAATAGSSGTGPHQPSGSGSRGRSGAGQKQPGGAPGASSADGKTTASRGAPGSRNSPGTGSGKSGSGSGSGPAGAPPPAGYRWQSLTAAALGTTAGFTIAAPDSWALSTHGMTAYLGAPGGSTSLDVSLSPFAYAVPVREARYLQAQAIATDEYGNYALIAIRPVLFDGYPAASWRFSWRPQGADRVTVQEILVTEATSAGSQSYALAVSAPTAQFAAASIIFRTSLATFSPLAPAS